jgi:sialidase-1
MNQITLEQTMNQITLELKPSPGNARNSEGSFVTLNDGRILFIWSKYTTDSYVDETPCMLVSRYSDDGGLTWSPEDEVVAEPEGKGHNVMSVSLLRLHNGRILLHYLQKEVSPKGIYQCTPMLRFSDDEGQSWSSAKSLTHSTEYHCVNNDRIIQLKDGTLVVPVAQHRFAMPHQLPADGELKADFKAPALIFFLISQDNGETWLESLNSFYRGFPDGSGFQEPGVIELDGKRLWSWTRTQWRNGEEHGRQWQSFSDDAGLTWEEPTPSVFVSPCSPLSMKRVPSTGELLAVWNDHSGSFPFPANPDYHDRQPLVAAISSDEGQTWKNHFLLEGDPDYGYCYTAIHFVDDAVLFAYCAGGPAPEICLQSLRIRRLTLDQLV